MISKFLKIIMVLTSIAPVFLTLWFIRFSKNWNYQDGVGWLILAISLIIVAYVILQISLKKLEHNQIKILSIASADKEVLAYVFSYLLPLIDIDFKIILFILILFTIIVFSTHIYHFNPIFGLLKYHFYEVTTSGGISYILMTKRQIRNVDAIKTVIIISDYILIDVTN